MLRIAIIGIGSMGKKYALMINGGQISGLQLVAVCARSEGSQEWARTELSQDCHCYATVEELYEHSEEFDAVLIVTPHKSHPQLACQAFEHHKHVFCDKPAGITTADAKQMTKAGKRAGVTYAMMFHKRTLPVYQKLKEILEKKQLGDLVRIQVTSCQNFRTKAYHESAAWRSSFSGEGGGALINQGQHLLDLWQWLFGMPKKVIAKIPFGKYNEFLVDDEVTMLMSYPDHVYAQLVVTTGEPFGKDRMEVIGTKGKVTLTGNQIEWEHSEQDCRTYQQQSEAVSIQEYPIETECMRFEMEENPYLVMLQNFTDAVTKGTPLIAPGSDGEGALELANAAYFSAWENREVTLPIDQTRYQYLLEQMIAKENGAKK